MLPAPLQNAHALSRLLALLAHELERYGARTQRRHSLVEFSGFGDGASLSGTILAESTPAAPTLTITVSVANVVLLAVALLVAGLVVGALWDGDGVVDSLGLSVLLASAVAGPAAAMTWFNFERCIKQAVARAVMATGEPRD